MQTGQYPSSRQAALCMPGQPPTSALQLQLSVLSSYQHLHNLPLRVSCPHSVPAGPECGLVLPLAGPWGPVRRQPEPEHPVYLGHLLCCLWSSRRQSTAVAAVQKQGSAQLTSVAGRSINGLNGVSSFLGKHQTAHLERSQPSMIG